MDIYVTFRGTERSPALEAFVREQAERLERFSERIVTCRVVVERPQARRGGPWHVRIDLRLPGEEIVVKRQPSLHATLAEAADVEETKAEEIEAPFKDAYFAVSEAFRAAGRRLQDYVRRHQGAVKVHEPQPVARVIRLDPQSGFGFLEAADGHEIYFHKNSVLGGAFEHLAIGASVTYVEELGEQGPQASTVRPLKKKSRGEEVPSHGR